MLNPSGKFAQNKDITYMSTFGAVLVFDVTHPESFNALEGYIKEIVDIIGHIPVIIIGNKTDLRDSGEYPDSVTDDIVQNYVRKVVGQLNENEIPVQYFPVCSVQDKNIDRPFEFLAEYFFGKFNTSITHSGQFKILKYGYYRKE